MSDALFKQSIPLASVSADYNRHLTISQISEGIRDLAARYNGIKNIVLIGSYARQTAKMDSDIDLIIELEDELDSESYFGFLDDAEDYFKKKIDLFTMEDAVSYGIVADIVYAHALPLREIVHNVVEKQIKFQKTKSKECER